MNFNIHKFLPKLKTKQSLKKKLSLSNFFPEDTVYFYGYPAGEASGFLNLVTPDVEEIVAARPNSIAGDSIYVINFNATSKQTISESLLKDFGLDTLPASQQYIVPANITADITGSERNSMIKKYLLSEIPAGKLVMAQPFSEDEMKSAYLINPDITTWFNDKKHMSEYIDNAFIPKRFGEFTNGEDVKKAASSIQAPVVIKITSSSAGDGVYLCRTDESIAKTAEKLSNFTGNIVIEQFIDATHNFGLQFGVSYKGDYDLISISEQITTPHGEFLGGVIDSTNNYEVVQPAVKMLKEQILPFVQKKGWYGIGCFDVLVDAAGNCYFIDANFRMTGMSACIFNKINKDLKTSVLSFGAKFSGSEEALRSALEGHIQTNKITLFAMSKNDTNWQINGCINYETGSDLHETITSLKSSNVKSAIFENELLLEKTLAH